MIGAAILLGGVGAGGVWLIVSGWSPLPTPLPHRRRWRDVLTPDVEPTRLLAPTGAAIVVLLLTRQPAAASFGAMAGWFAVSWRRRGPHEAAQAEAIALWTETLRNAVGAADGVETVLAGSARHAPALIRDDVQRLVDRLPFEPLEDVLADRPGALQHPSADLVFRALGQAATEGGSLYGVLDRLAKQARAAAEMHRRIEVAREQPRSTMRTVTVVIALFTGGLFFLASDWMSAYGTPVGQLVLVAVAAWFVLWHRQLTRMARVEPIQRFYTPGDRG